MRVRRGIKNHVVLGGLTQVSTLSQGRAMGYKMLNIGVVSVSSANRFFRHVGTHPESVRGVLYDEIMSLNEQEKAILGFERQRWRMPVEKEHAIAQAFGLSGPRYYQLLNALLDRQEAMAEDPLLISRLRRIREEATRRQPHGSKVSSGRP